MGNILVGGVFAAILFFAFKKTREDIKNNKCAGCGGGCSPKKKKDCSSKLKGIL